MYCRYHSRYKYGVQWFEIAAPVIIELNGANTVNILFLMGKSDINLAILNGEGKASMLASSGCHLIQLSRSSLLEM